MHVALRPEQTRARVNNTSKPPPQQQPQHTHTHTAHHTPHTTHQTQHRHTAPLRSAPLRTAPHRTAPPPQPRRRRRRRRRSWRRRRRSWRSRGCGGSTTGSLRASQSPGRNTRLGCVGVGSLLPPRLVWEGKEEEEEEEKEKKEEEDDMAALVATVSRQLQFLMSLPILFFCLRQSTKAFGRRSRISTAEIWTFFDEPLVSGRHFFGAGVP